MALFSKETASGLADCIASSAWRMNYGLAAALNAGPTVHGNLYGVVTADQVYQVERDFITPTYEFEQLVASGLLLGARGATSALLNAFDSHCSAEAGVSFDTYLTNSGLRVSSLFADLYVASKPGGLSAKNVFVAPVLSPADLLGELPYLGVTDESGNWTESLAGYGSAVGPIGTGAAVYVPGNVGATPCTYQINGRWNASGTKTVTFVVSGLGVNGATSESGSRTGATSGSPPYIRRAFSGTLTNRYYRITSMTASSSGTAAPLSFNVRPVPDRVVTI